MRRSLDVLRRAWQGKDRGLPSDDNPRRRLPLLRVFRLPPWSCLPRLVAVAGAADAVIRPRHQARRPDAEGSGARRSPSPGRPRDFSKPEQFELMQGGAGTSRRTSTRTPSRNPRPTSPSRRRAPSSSATPSFARIWVSAPSSTQASDGLGPLFNARACQNCHLKDGRGHPPEGDQPAPPRCSCAWPATPSTAEEKAAVADHKVLNFPDPVYGGQLQDLAVPGLQGEGKMAMSTISEQKVTLQDGSVVSLRKPSYSVDEPRSRPARPCTPRFRRA